MLEELCRNAFYRACWDEKEKREPMVTLKGREKPPREFEQFFSWDSGFQEWDGTFVKKMVKAKKNESISLARQWFNDHSFGICDGYIRQKFGGDLRRAMIESGSFETLYNGFLEYFADRRNRFMQNTKNMIDIQKQGLPASWKMPQSHGGVASLLKVLTKTMERQGSSIRTIAKVQHAVCIQAGIFIPNEFLTDVLVAANIEENQEGNADA